MPASQTIPADEWDTMKAGHDTRPRFFSASGEEGSRKFFIDTKITANGNAVFYPTSDGTAEGTPIFSAITGVFIRAGADDRILQVGEPVIGEGNVSITIPVIQVTNVLLGLLQLTDESNGRGVTILVYGT